MINQTHDQFKSTFHDLENILYSYRSQPFPLFSNFCDAINSCFNCSPFQKENLLTSPAMKQFNRHVEILRTPVAKMMIIFLTAIGDQFNKDALTAAYKQAIAEIQNFEEYKIENYLSCKYCQHILEHSQDKTEIRNALFIQEDLLDDFEIGAEIIDDMVFFETYEQQLTRYLKLLAKCFDLNINVILNSGHIDKSIISLGTHLSNIIASYSTPNKISVLALYHLACLRMRYDNLDFCNFPKAYGLLKGLLDKPLNELEFPDRIKYRLAEFIRQNLYLFDYDDSEIQYAYQELRALLLEVIYKGTDKEMKARSQYCYARSFLHFSPDNDNFANFAKSGLLQVLKLAKPSSILIAIARQELGILLIFGHDGKGCNPNRGKEYLHETINSNLLNELTKKKLHSTLNILTISKKFPDPEQIVATEISNLENPTETSITKNLVKLRRLFGISLELMAMDDTLSMIHFIKNFGSFIKENYNFNTQFFKNHFSFKNINEEKSLADIIFNKAKVNSIMWENCVDLVTQDIEQHALHDLYQVDRLINITPDLSLEILQKNLTLLYLLFSFKFANTCSQCPKLFEVPHHLVGCNITPLTRNFFRQNFKGSIREGVAFHQKLLNLKNETGTVAGIIKMIGAWIHQQCQKYPSPDFPISKKEMILICVVNEWATLKALPKNPQNKQIFRLILKELQTTLGTTKSENSTITNNKKSQSHLINEINFQKLLIKITQKLTHIESETNLASIDMEYFKLSGLLAGEEKETLLIKLARYNRDLYLRTNPLTKKKFSLSLILSIQLYLKAFKLSSSTKTKLAILDELFTFGPSSFNDYQEIWKKLEQNEPDARSKGSSMTKRYLLLHLLAKIEYLHFDDQLKEADSLIHYLQTKDNKILLSELINQSDIFDNYEAGYKLQFFIHDKDARKKFLSEIAPESLPQVQFEFDLPMQQSILQKIASSQQIQSNHHTTPSDPSIYYPFNEGSFNEQSTTAETKREAKICLQKSEDKRSKKCKASPSSNTDLISEYPSNKVEKVSAQVNSPIKIYITPKGMTIFNKLWQYKKATALTNPFDAHDFRNDVKITKKEVQKMIADLGGFYKSGNGSHVNCIIPSIDTGDTLTLNGQTMRFANFGILEQPTQKSNSNRPTPQRATMPLPNNSYLDEFLVIQLRTKLIALGYTPLTVAVKQ